MTSFNVMAGGRQQVLVDEQQLQQLQAEYQRRGNELERLKSAMESLSAINLPAHFMAAAMALCNELATRWKAERVGIGFLRVRAIRLRALSHTEKLTRSMQLVQDIEAAMEECLDQDVEVLVPPPKDASFVYRNANQLASRNGPNAVISLPLRRERKNIKERNDERFGNVVGVLTLERKTDKPFTLQEIETLRLTCDLFTARLVDLYEHDRWIGAKALRETRRIFAWAVGAKHTWAKMAAVAAFLFLAFAFLKDGMYRVEAPFVIESVHKQTVAAPFEGVLKSVNADVNDIVFTPATGKIIDDLNDSNPISPVLNIPRPKSILATLETDIMEQERNAALSRVAAAHEEAEKNLPEATAKPDSSKMIEVQMAETEARRAQAEADSLSLKIEKAVILAPVDGIVLSGDLKSKVGAPVRPGDELFQIGGEEIRAEISVPEDQITEIKKGSTGILKSTSFPDRPIHYTIERVSPVATPSKDKNVFKVRAKLDDATSAWLRSGIEGLSKTDVEPHKYAWIWTRRMVNWVRMKLWM